MPSHCPSVISQPDVLARAWRWRASLTLGPWRSAVPCGRAHAVACLAEWGLSSARDSVELVVSELLTNAITASDALEGGPYPVRLWLQADGSQILIMVGDASGQAPGRQNPADDQEGGRGLLLVEAESVRWDWFRCERGKVVWAVCEAPSQNVTGLASGSTAPTSYSPPARVDAEALGRPLPAP